MHSVPEITFKARATLSSSMIFNIKHIWTNLALFKESHSFSYFLRILFGNVQDLRDLEFCLHPCVLLNFFLPCKVASLHRKIINRWVGWERILCVSDVAETPWFPGFLKASRCLMAQRSGKTGRGFTVSCHSCVNTHMAYATGRHMTHTSPCRLLSAWHNHRSSASMGFEVKNKAWNIESLDVHTHNTTHTKAHLMWARVVKYCGPVAQSFCRRRSGPTDITLTV